MSFDEYFDLNDRMDRLDQLVAFAVGLAPRATHLRYLDLSQVNIATGAGSSAGLACQLASGAAAAAKILLGRKPLRPVPSTPSTTPTATFSAAVAYCWPTATRSSASNATSSSAA